MSEERHVKGTLCESEIIRLYENGLSQNDILRLYSVPLKTTRAILKAAGFDTASYRRIPTKHEEIIDILLRAGITLRRISEVTDISFFVISDISKRQINKIRQMRLLNDEPATTRRERKFLSQYLSGFSFCSIANSMSLNKKELLRCFAMLDEAAQQQHGEALRVRLNGEDMTQNTVTSLARKYGISRSVVQAHLNS